MLYVNNISKAGKQDKKPKFYIKYFSIQNQKNCLSFTLDMAWYYQLCMVKVDFSEVQKFCVLVSYCYCNKFLQM